LIKSSVVARFGRGTHIGFDAASARERVASLGYRRGVAVAQRQHAIDRQRALFAGALGYPTPADVIDYGIDVHRADASGLVLAHGTTWTNKRWPEPFWADLATRALSCGERVTLPWGNPDEGARARRIAALAPGAVVAPRLDLRGMIDLLARSAAVVSVDSGIGHLAAALGIRTVALYGPTDAQLTGCRGASVTNLSARFACAPCLERHCGYRGAPQFIDAVRVEPACFATITPECVWQTLCGSAVGT
jgi:heptosyltransferase-1